MGKRSDFERVPRDYYPTPIEAVRPLVPHLPDKGLFGEPCAGDGRLIRHIEELTGMLGYWMTDIEPMADFVGDGDATTDKIVGCDVVITNPPWNRKILHPIIENLSDQLPTWLLFDADWIHTKQSIPYLTRLKKVVSIGRVKWIEDSKGTGKDNCCWYLFGKPNGFTNTVLWENIMIYKLIEAESPSLMAPLPDITFDEIKTKYDLTPQELYDNLKDTMTELRGIGLSANQVGLSIRAFCMYTDLKDGNVEIYFNPKIIWQSEETEFYQEGCLSYPQLYLNLKRPKVVEFEYMDINGEQQTGKFAGLTARIFQHEYDHMDGKNFTMWASKMKMDMALKKQQKKLKKVLKTS